MGLIWKAASIIALAGLSNHARREPPGKAALDQAKAAREQARTAREQARTAREQAKAAREQAKAETARVKAAQAQAELAEAKTKMAKEQATAIARAMQEDEARRQADLEEVAEEEAEAVPWERPAES